MEGAVVGLSGPEATRRGELSACTQRAKAFGTCDRVKSLSLSPNSAANGDANSRCTSAGDGYATAMGSAACAPLLLKDGKEAADEMERGLLC